jgi:hypothetical protein
MDCAVGAVVSRIVVYGTRILIAEEVNGEGWNGMMESLMGIMLKSLDCMWDVIFDIRNEERGIEDISIHSMYVNMSEQSNQIDP